MSNQENNAEKNNRIVEKEDKKEYEKKIFLSNYAEEKLKRYEDQMTFLEDLFKTNKNELSKEERNLLSIAYKNNISLIRDAIQNILSFESQESKKPESPYLKYIKEYKNILQQKLEDLCDKIINTIKNNFLPAKMSDEGKIFFHNIIGDYYRYMAETADVDTFKKYREKSLESYDIAFNLAEKLDYKDPLRLGLVLNLSIFYYDIDKNTEKACTLAEDIISKSKNEIINGDEEEDEDKDAKYILKFLEENLAKWKSKELDKS